MKYLQYFKILTIVYVRPNSRHSKRLICIGMHGTCLCLGCGRQGCLRYGTGTAVVLLRHFFATVRYGTENSEIPYRSVLC